MEYRYSENGKYQSGTQRRGVEGGLIVLLWDTETHSSWVHRDRSPLYMNLYTGWIFCISYAAINKDPVLEKIKGTLNPSGLIVQKFRFLLFRLKVKQ